MIFSSKKESFFARLNINRADEVAVDRVVDAVAALAVVPERVVVLGEILGLIGPIFHDEIKCEKCG